MPLLSRPDSPGKSDRGTLRLLYEWGKLSLYVVLLSGCRSPAKPTSEEVTMPVWFTDVTAECGLDFVHDAGPTGSYFMPQIIGSGAALFDMDNDGLLDIYLLQNGGPSSTSKNQLYRQGRDGRFSNVSQGSGLDVAGWNMGLPSETSITTAGPTFWSLNMAA